MKAGLTEIVCVLDRSGSMKPLQDETITKFNEFIRQQKEVPGEATVTVVLFDDEFETPHQGVALDELPELTDEVYFARGWTRLNDALGKTINEVGGRLNSLSEEERPEKVIVMVITDGRENSSKEFPGEDGRQKVKEMIEHQRAKYAWEFLFLGANIDSKVEGQRYGIVAAMCADFGHTKKGLSSAYSASGNRVARMRGMSPKEYKNLGDLNDETSKD